MAKPESGRTEAARGVGRAGSGSGRRASDESVTGEAEALEPSRRRLGELDASAPIEPVGGGARLNADGVLEPAARTQFTYDPSERAAPAEQAARGGEQEEAAGVAEEHDPSAPTVASNTARAAMMFEALQAQDDDAAEQAPPPRASGRRAMFEGGAEAAAAVGPAPAGAEDAAPSGRSGRALLTLLLVGAVAAGAFLYASPTGGSEGDERADEIARREALPPGRDLLALELADPLLGDVRLRASLDALGPKAATTLEDLAATGGTAPVRRRAFDLWLREGYAKEGEARLRLVRRLGEQEVAPDPQILALLAADIERRPPTDAAAMEVLDAAQGAAWRSLVKLLGRPGEPGAAARAEALTRQLPRDDEEATALLGLLRTGHGPPDGLAQLIRKRGLPWAQGPGRATLVPLAGAQPSGLESLLALSEEHALVALELLGEANTDKAQRLLITVMRDRERRALRLRLRAILALVKAAPPEAGWPLLLLALSPAEEELVKDEARRALDKLSHANVARQLEPHLAPKQPETERHYAVRGLGLIDALEAQPLLLKVLAGDPSLELRRLALRLLSEPTSDEKVKQALGREAAPLREVARREPDPTLRAAAAKLYQAVTGRAP